MTHSLTDLLLAHRAAGTTITDLPDTLVPQSAEEAYLIQNESVAALGPVGAWKVQPLPQTGLPFAAPILKRTIFESGSTLRKVDYAGLGIEVEVAVTISRDLPAKDGGYTADDMRAAIASAHLALEILASRFQDRTKVPQLAGIADFQSGGAIVVGAAVDLSTLGNFDQQVLALRFDGQDAGSTKGNASTENMMGALAWLADHTAARGLPLKAGDVVITGSRIGPLPFAGTEVTAEAPGLGNVNVRFS